MTVLERWTRFHSLILGVALAALGVWALANGHYVAGPLNLGFSAYELLTYFQGRRPVALGGPKTDGQRP